MSQPCDNNDDSQLDWAQAGRALLFCSGAICVALALHRGDGVVGQLLRTYVGLLGVGLSLFAVRARRR